MSVETPSTHYNALRSNMAC